MRLSYFWFLLALTQVRATFDPAFLSYVEQYDKKYVSVEEMVFRQTIYMNRIAQHQSYNLEEKEWTMGTNQFTDLTDLERTQILAGCTFTNVYDRNCSVFGEDVQMDTIPDTADWRKEGVITPVKDQGNCGSCWAFSTIAALEAMRGIEEGKVMNMSEQELVDCATEWGNNGCGGGFMDNALRYVIDRKGVCSATDYPYAGIDGVCRRTMCRGGMYAPIRNCVAFPVEREDYMASVVFTRGPVVVAVDASGWFDYRGGVYSGGCSSEILNHGVLIVGYGPDYWIIKNSWGPKWGEGGYIRLKRGVDQCGVSQYASYVIY